MDSLLGSFIPISIASLVLYVALQTLSYNRTNSLKAPVVGRYSVLEPEWLLRLRYIGNAWDMLAEGYGRFKDRIFVVKRCDHDIAIIPSKYVDELRSMPEHRVSAIEMHVKNLLGPYTTMDIALQSSLHTRAIQQKLTPNIGRFIEPIQDELKYALQAEMPRQDSEWHEIPISTVLLRMTSRVSARAFVGLPLCRNEEWLQINMDTAINVLQTMMTLRMLPSFLHFLHPILIYFLPSWYRLHSNIRGAKRLAMPVISTHMDRREKGEVSPKDSMTLLEWMSDTAENELEADPARLSHLLILIGLGSIHTMKTALVHMVWDLVARPDLIPELRSEVEDVLRGRGGKWDKPALTRMLKVESFMTESMRLNPPSLLAFHRLTKEPIVLIDGTRIPAHTHLAVPAAHLLLDPAHVLSPDDFDASRSYRARVKDPGERHKHQFATTDTLHMHFGHGKYACPGRIYTANQIKLVLAEFLTGWDWKFPEGKRRPKNKTVDEYLFPEEANVMIKWRENYA